MTDTRPEHEFCIFTLAGKVQYLDGTKGRGLMIAYKHETATRVAKELVGKPSVAQIGTMPGETLPGLITAALRDGVDCVYEMGFDDKGELAAHVYE